MDAMAFVDVVIVHAIVLAGWCSSPLVSGVSSLQLTLSYRADMLPVE